MAIPELLTLNAEHFLLHILPDRNIEGGQDLYILKVVINRNIQDVLAQTSLPACAIQTPITLTAKFPSKNKMQHAKSYAPKAVLRRKFMAVNDYVEKQYTLKSLA